MPNMKIDGFNMHYNVEGTGTPLIMIMGLGANSHWWDEALINQLSEHFKVIVFDNRGAGQSEDPGDDFTIERLAKDVAELMNQLNIKEAYIMGISMGGMIAQQLALNYPEKIIKLILASTNCGGSKSIPPSPEVIKMLSKPRKNRPIIEIINELISLFYSVEFRENNPKTITRIKKDMRKFPISDETYKKQGKAIFSFNTCEALKDLQIPTLILHGTKDKIFPYKNAEILNDLIPQSDLSVMEGRGHAYFSQLSEEVFATIKHFLEN